MSSIENKRIALFPGTFDPFTIGHQSLVRRGLELVDEIVISIGINDKKLTYFSLEKRMEAIWNLYKDKLTGIETFILFTEPEHTHISSSIVRELLRYGKDISQFVPKETRLY